MILDNNPISQQMNTLLASVKMLPHPHNIQIIGHHITKLNQIAKRLWKAQNWSYTAYIPDHAFDSLNPNRSIYHHFNDIKPVSIDDLLKLCQTFQFPEDKLYDKPRTLSSGQCQLIAIMLSYYQNPRVIIANQPFNAIDVQRKENLLDIMNQSNISFVVLTHQEIIGLDTYKTIYCEDIQKQHTFLLKRSKSNHTIIRLHQVILNHVSLSPISLNLCQEITGLVGPNGSGKTSLAKTIMHNLPYQGRIDILEEHFPSAKALYQKRYLQFLFQNTHEMFHPMYPLGSILEEDLDQDLFFKTLEAFPSIDPWKHAYPKDVSSETLKTLAFSRLIARSPIFIILDEPLSGMNHAWIDALFQVLLSLNIGILIIDHDIDALKTICNEIYTISHGSVHVL